MIFFPSIPPSPLPLSYEAALSKNESVSLPIGTWSLSSALTPGDNATIVGYGCTLVPAQGYNGPAIDAKGTGVQIVGPTIQGFSTGIWMRGSSLDSGRTAFIKDAEIDDYAGGYGIRWDSPSDGRVSNVTVANRIGTNGLPWLNNQIGVSANTALAGIYLGPDAGGTQVSDIHSWGNACYDLKDFAPDSILSGVRLEGGRLAHLELAAWRIKVNGGTIWEPANNGWHPYGVQVGDANNTDARYAAVDGLALGVSSVGNLAADVRVVHGSYNFFRLFRRKADPAPLTSGQTDSSSTYVWVSVP